MANVLQESEVREAVRAAGKWRLFPKKSSAKDMTVENIAMSDRHIYYFKVLVEYRKIVWDSVAYEPGMLVDGPSNGPPVSMWSISVISPTGFDFKTKNDSIKYVIPHTSVVCICKKCFKSGEIKCFNCSGKGAHTCTQCNGSVTVTGYDETECDSCSGQGKIPSFKPCNMCNGSGKVNYISEDINCKECSGKGTSPSSESCGNCKGSGSLTKSGQAKCTSCCGQGSMPCYNCHGTGHRKCPACAGSGELKKFQALSVNWKVIKEKPTDLEKGLGCLIPEKKLKTVKGKKVEYLSEGCDVNNNPLSQHSEERVREISKTMFEKYELDYVESSDGSHGKRIINCQQIVKTIPIAEVTTHCQGNLETFFVYGNERKVFYPNGQGCCSIV